MMTQSPIRKEKSKKHRRSPKMTGDSKFSEVVELSDEDQCYIGYCPGIIGPCCHGDDVTEVRRELRQIVDEWLEMNGKTMHDRVQVCKNRPQSEIRRPSRAD